jgi:hypothetical protein
MPRRRTPCGFKWVIEAKKQNKARLVVVDPRFTRSAAMADYYAPVRAGSDIAFLGGHQLPAEQRQDPDTSTCATTPTRRSSSGDYKFEDGIFSGYDAEKRNYDPKSWNYALDEAGMAKVDMTMQDPQCVLQVMKRHYSRYTPELVSRITRHAAGQVPEGLRVHREHAVHAHHDDHHVCAGLDAAQPGLADDPHRRHRAAAAGQHRHAGRRHERAARPQQHPGPDRPGPAVELAAGLHVAGGRASRTSTTTTRPAR